jgi:arsenate reductase
MLAYHRKQGEINYMGKLHFGYLITVCANTEEKCLTTFPGVEQRLHRAFDDPAAFEGTDEEKLQVFRAVRDQIDQRIRAWLTEQAMINARQ